MLCTNELSDSATFFNPEPMLLSRSDAPAGLVTTKKTTKASKSRPMIFFKLVAHSHRPRIPEEEIGH